VPSEQKEKGRRFEILKGKKQRIGKDHFQHRTGEDKTSSNALQRKKSTADLLRERGKKKKEKKRATPRRKVEI